MFATGYHRLTVWLKHVQSLVICWTKVTLINKAEIISGGQLPGHSTCTDLVSLMKRGTCSFCEKQMGRSKTHHNNAGRIVWNFGKENTDFLHKICQFLSRFVSCRAPIKIVICLSVCMKLSQEMLKGFQWNFMVENSNKILNWFQF